MLEKESAILSLPHHRADTA